MVNSQLHSSEEDSAEHFTRDGLQDNLSPVVAVLEISFLLEFSNSPFCPIVLDGIFVSDALEQIC